MTNRHLEQSQTTYWSHFCWAILAGFRLIWAGIASLLHAVHPSLFPGTAAVTVIDMYYKRLHRHPNPEYQQQIKKAVDEVAGS